MKACFLVLALAAALLCSCDSGDAPKPAAKTAAAAASQADTPVTGGRIVQPLLGEPSNLIAALATDASSHSMAQHLYVAPLRYNKNIELEPWAAESYEVLEDGKLLRFKLRENIRWFDGQPLTAADVEFTVKLMLDPKTPTAYSDDYRQIKEFKVTGPYSFEVRYDKPFARALVTWAGDILPKHVLEHEDLLKTKYSREPMGAGAYRLKEWVPGNRLVFTANPDYFEGRPYLDEVVYRVIPDQSTQFLELKAGNLDSMELTAKQYLYQTKGQEWAAYNKFEYLSFSYTFLGYNLKRPMFQSKKVRQALTMAIDKDEIVKGVLFGLGQAAQGPYKPGTWVYDDALKAWPFDQARAKALLAEEGWTPGPDGILQKNGQPFSFTILTNQGNEQRVKAATIIQERFKQIGVQVEIRTVEWAAFINEFVNKGRFDALILGWNILQDPDIFSVWHSSQIGDGKLNMTAYANPELDGLLERGRHTLDQAERKKIYDRVQEILYEDQPYTFLYVPMSLPIVHARYHGVEVAPSGIGWNFDRWWIPKAQQQSPTR